MKNYIKSFFKEEEGFSVIEFLIILVIIAGLIVIAVTVASLIGDKAEEAQSEIESALNAI